MAFSHLFCAGSIAESVLLRNKKKWYILYVYCPFPGERSLRVLVSVCTPSQWIAALFMTVVRPANEDTWWRVMEFWTAGLAPPTLSRRRQTSFLVNHEVLVRTEEAYNCGVIWSLLQITSRWIKAAFSVFINSFVTPFVEIGSSWMLCVNVCMLGL